MDATTIMAAYSGLKSAVEIFKSYMDVKTEIRATPQISDAFNKLSQAQDVIYEMRDELFRLQTENHNLKCKISESENWDARTSFYELVKTRGGATVYQYKKQPLHYACPHCYENKNIQILQGERRMHCPSCENVFQVEPQELFPNIGICRA